MRVVLSHSLGFARFDMHAYLPCNTDTYIYYIYIFFLLGHWFKYCTYAHESNWTKAITIQYIYTMICWHGDDNGWSEINSFFFHPHAASRYVHFLLVSQAARHHGCKIAISFSFWYFSKFKLFFKLLIRFIILVYNYYLLPYNFWKVIL